MELVPAAAAVAALVPVVFPTSEISGTYLDLVRAARALSWVVIGKPRSEDQTESVRKHCF